jgi:phage terminase small subunit
MQARNIPALYTPGSLTRKQAVFVEEYLTNGYDSLAAAQTAGYAGPKQSAHQNLHDAVVLAEIRTRMGQYDDAQLLPRYLQSIKQDLESDDPQLRGEARREYGRHLRAKWMIEERMSRAAEDRAGQLDGEQLRDNLASNQELKKLLESQLEKAQLAPDQDPDPAELLA